MGAYLRKTGKGEEQLKTGDSLPSDEPYRSHDFSVNLGEGGSIHDHVARYAFLEELTQLPRPVHSITGDDIVRREGKGETLRLYEPNMAVLFGPPQSYGLYSIVKEFPYYHLDSYPPGADESVIEDFIRSEMEKKPEIYRNQEIGDVDVGVFDRRDRIVHQVEVKTNDNDLDDAKEDIEKFHAYGGTLGWDVDADIAVFQEEERLLDDMVVKGRIEWYRYTP